MTTTIGEQPLFASQIADMFGNVVSEASWRAWTRRAKNPCPCVACGDKRPHRKIYPTVAAAMLGYEMGVVPYAEVELAARRVLEGARQ